MPSACPPCSTPLLSVRGYLVKTAFPESGTDPFKSSTSNSSGASYVRCVLDGIVVPKVLDGGLRLDVGRKGARRRRRQRGRGTRKRSLATELYHAASRREYVARIRRRRGSGWFRATGHYTISRTSTNCMQYTLCESSEDCILRSNRIASDFSRNGTAGRECFSLQCNFP